MNKQWQLIIIVGFLVLAGLWPAPAQAQTETAARLWIEIADTAVLPGETVTAVVHVANNTPIYGADIQLTFDPALLVVVDVDAATEGVQAQPGDYLDTGQAFVLRHQVDNAAGTVAFALTLLRPATAVTGEGRLLTVTFQVVGSGETAVQLTRGLLGTPDGETVAPQLADGRVAITPAAAVPAPAEKSDQPANEVATQSTALPQATAVGGAGWLPWLAALLLVGGLLVVGWRWRQRPLASR